MRNIKIKEGQTTYVIFSLKVANKLHKRGHKIIKTSININNPNKVVFIVKVGKNFKEDLQLAICQTYKEKQIKNK